MKRNIIVIVVVLVIVAAISSIFVYRAGVNGREKAAFDYTPYKPHADQMLLVFLNEYNYNYIQNLHGLKERTGISSSPGCADELVFNTQANLIGCVRPGFVREFEFNNNATDKGVLGYMIFRNATQATQFLSDSDQAAKAFSSKMKTPITIKDSIRDLTVYQPGPDMQTSRYFYVRQDGLNGTILKDHIVLMQENNIIIFSSELTNKVAIQRKFTDTFNNKYLNATIKYYHLTYKNLTYTG